MQNHLTVRSWVLYGLTCLVSVTGCKRESPRKHDVRAPATVATLKVEPDENILLLSEVADSLHYLPLASDPSHLIGNVDKLMCVDERFYILDRDAAKSLFVFGKDGRFLFQIKRTGQGPGEYVRPDDFTVDSYHDSRSIIILDTSQRKLLKYDQNGDYLEEIRLPFFAYSFAQVGPDSFVFYHNYVSLPGTNDNTSYNLTFVKENKILKQLFPYEVRPNPLRFAPQTVFSVTSGGVIFMPSLRDTVYRVNKTQVNPLYSIDFGKTKLPKEFLLRRVPHAQLLKAISNYSHFIENYSETENHVCFDFGYHGRRYSAFYSKKTNHVRASALLANDMDGGVFASPVAACGDEFIGVLDPLELMDIYGKRKHKISPALVSVIKKLTDLSNPVLVFYRLRDF